MFARCSLITTVLLFSLIGEAQEIPIHSISFLLEGDAFVRLPAGQFDMGSTNGNDDERPVHRVRISRSIEIGRYEVTQAQWDAVMRKPHASTDTRSRSVEVNPSKFKGPDRPVENVAWQDVQVFIETLNRRDRKHVYRLPTEAEWEYAARAGSTQKNVDDSKAVGWHKENSGGETHPIGQKSPNAWGLHDMLGNVQEWVQDWYAPGYLAGESTDPQGNTEGSYRVYRGCAWLSEAKYCRPAYRAFDFPNQGQYSVGFRLVRSPK
jgi:formylglycine-generating enzyme required for sulfatase activity